MIDHHFPEHLVGLSQSEIEQSRSEHGENQMDAVSNNTWLRILMDIVKEPMLILLFAITIIYVIVGDYGEALFMFLAIIAVSAISFYQDSRSKKALDELEKLNEPLSKVIRAGTVLKIPSHEIVVGDLCITEEGKMVNADGRIRHSHDFSVNESALTGESYSVYKNNEEGSNEVFSGTLTLSGLAVFEVEKVGRQTRIGQIGHSLQTIKAERSPLHLQIQKFVQWMAVVGVIVFLMVWGFSYLQMGHLMDSLLVGLTMAMSVLPEEIPVAFTTFMALGAWKLMKDGVLIKRSSVVETLGSTTVICADKTGTITQNSMQLKHLYDFPTQRVYDAEHFDDRALSELIAYAMWSSEPVPFDPMERSLHQAYENTQAVDQRQAFRMTYEYPLEGKPPMMTHVLENEANDRILAAKGAPEAILAVSQLSEPEKQQIRNVISDFGKQGYRMLAVARSDFSGSAYPDKQQEIPFEFLGLVVFYDPPKAGIQEVFSKIYQAGIRVKMITGDNAETSSSIAEQAGIRNSVPIQNGSDVAAYSEEELLGVADRTVLFTRMFPDAKLAVVNALKKNGEVVAMLGDGVNDGPALKAAHIGVAMGSKGTEIAKAAASLIILNDDLDKLVTGIAAGRRIYDNIKKAIQYIISIHIPIILVVSLPLFLGWVFPHIFTPVHVIFMELIMGPTCSIVYENEPMEKNTMQRPPRKMTETFLNFKEIGISIVQGLLITAGVLLAYQWAVQRGGTEEMTRAMVFTTLIFANILLSLVNRSFIHSVVETFKYKNKLFPLIIGITLVLLFAILYVPAFASFFHVTGLNLAQLAMALLIAAASVLWFEVYKWVKRTKLK